MRNRRAVSSVLFSLLFPSTLTAPLNPGEYEARFYASSAYDKLVERVRFTVYPRE